MSAGKKDKSPKENAKISDVALVARVKNLDAAAFTLLREKYAGKIYGLIFNMMNNREDAEDLHQIVWLQVWRKLKFFEGKSSFYTWVYSVAVNHCLNALKKRNKRTDKTFSLDDDTLDFMDEFAPEEMRYDADIQGTIDRKMLLMIVKRCIEKLSHDHREVLLLNLAGKKSNEIARQLGISEGTIRSRLYYARQALQQHL